MVDNIVCTNGNVELDTETVYELDEVIYLEEVNKGDINEAENKNDDDDNSDDGEDSYDVETISG